ncbi:unnamed protein product [Leptosia nina]|uniref:Uncharacterized protein n=1 Tax=Leptosia nina TaxID=320188 RepID=A0AAV1K2Q8_9NEOP
MLNEQDLIVARALAAESRDSSPGGSPGPLRKNPLNNVGDKLNTFRSLIRYQSGVSWLVTPEARQRVIGGSLPLVFRSSSSLPPHCNIQKFECKILQRPQWEADHRA